MKNSPIENCQSKTRQNKEFSKAGKDGFAQMKGFSDSKLPTKNDAGGGSDCLYANGCGF